ncbi:metalloregulator ArsR/SmtB family transcription factor [Nocardioides sp. CER19]|uniref:ArsR/SmtB family transcription factor n=1 Tax=Nocardioides sp. CER19 TaxID=3038538 RepID=UPI00244B858A|nr:metalloregulator ArsR/SmtB family transcription factor [Nocardioides sp. CER19]MDH2415228.1 metalloregulator ArsR/SmtB family transcription factor [Nocardioides sp. CER19]
MSGPVDDELWSAIGDPTRRQMLDLLLTAGSGTATSLSERLPVSRQAVAKHLAVLDRAGLVHGETAGRERHYRIDGEQFERALAQLNTVSTAWDGRLRRIKRLAESLQQAANAPQPKTQNEPNTQNKEE